MKYLIPVTFWIVWEIWLISESDCLKNERCGPTDFFGFAIISVGMIFPMIAIYAVLNAKDK